MRASSAYPRNWSNSQSARPTLPLTGATSHIVARSPASMRASSRRPVRWAIRSRPGRRSVKAAPYPHAAEVELRSRRRASLPRDNGSAALAGGRLRRLRRAVDVFGFHLAGLDLRQNSDVHERTVGELVAAWLSLASLIGDLPEEERTSSF